MFRLFWILVYPFLTVGLGGCLIACDQSTANAADFRIDTMVFFEGENEALCQTTTYFHNQRIYDHLRGLSEEVTVFDLSTQRIFVLHPQSMQKAELTFDDLDQFVQATLVAARASPNYVKFAAAPRFETVVDKNDTLIRLTGSSISYQAETLRAPSSSVNERFRQFADWSAKLNTMRPGLPPTARMELNRKLALRQRIPKLVQCTIHVDGTHTNVLKSQHEYSWTLSPNDLTVVAQYDQDVLNFNASPISQIFRRERTQSAND